jgi:hypothetical protein
LCSPLGFCNRPSAVLHQHDWDYLFHVPWLPLLSGQAGRASLCTGLTEELETSGELLGAREELVPKNGGEAGPSPSVQTAR